MRGDRWVGFNKSECLQFTILVEVPAMNDDRRGLKRFLDVAIDHHSVEIRPLWPHIQYAVFAYSPALCDQVLRDENYKEQLPNVHCNGCPSSFEQMSITEYTVSDESGSMYADLQFHHHGGLCIWCRAPYPGEGHFEQRHVHDGISANPLTEYLNAIGVGVSWKRVGCLLELDLN
jgi:hypothetical protein